MTDFIVSSFRRKLRAAATAPTAVGAHRRDCRLLVNQRWKELFHRRRKLTMPWQNRKVTGEDCGTGVRDAGRQVSLCLSALTRTETCRDDWSRSLLHAISALQSLSPPALFVRSAMFEAWARKESAIDVRSGVRSTKYLERSALSFVWNTSHWVQRTSCWVPGTRYGVRGAGLRKARLVAA